MDTPKKGYSRSEWSALSIQERIRAMNDTLDTVEASPANMNMEMNHSEEDGDDTDTYGGYSMTTGTLSESFSPVQSMRSEEDMAVPVAAAPAEAVARPKRSSVVDLWRKREEEVAGTGAGPPAAGAATASVKKTQVSKVPEAAARELRKNDSASTATTTSTAIRSNREQQVKEQEEKKEQYGDDPEDSQSQHEKSPAPSAVRNMWSQRVANSPVPVVPKKTVPAVARKSPVALPIKMPLSLQEVPSDLTFMPPEEETEDSTNNTDEDNKRSSPKMTNIWAQRGLQRVRTPSPVPSDAAAAAAATAAQEFASPAPPPSNGNKRVSVVDSWNKRKSPQSQQQQQQSPAFEEAASKIETIELFAPPKPRGLNNRQHDPYNNNNNIQQQESEDQESSVGQSVDLSISAVDSKVSESSGFARRAKAVSICKRPVVVTGSVIATPMAEESENSEDGYARPPIVAIPAVVPVPKPVAAVAASSSIRVPSPKRSSVADRWAKRMGKSSPRGDAAATPEKQSFETQPATDEVVVSGLVIEPVESAPAPVEYSPAPAVTATLTVPVLSSPGSSIRAASPGRNKVADRWAKRLSGRPDTEVPVEDKKPSPNPVDDDKAWSDPTENAPVPVASASAPPVVPLLSSPPARAASPVSNNVGNRWAKRLGKRRPDTEESVEEQMSSTGTPDEALSDPTEIAPASIPDKLKPVPDEALPDPTESAPAPIPFKLKPVKATKRLGMLEAPNPSALPIDRASAPSKGGKVADRWPESMNAVELRPVRTSSLAPTRGNVAERWTTTNVAESPTRALHSKSPDVESMQQRQMVDPPGTPPPSQFGTAPPLSFERTEEVHPLEDIIKHPAEHLPSEGSVKSVATKKEEEIPQTTEPRAMSTVDDAQPTTSAAPKPASLIQAWNRQINTPKTTRPFKLPKPLKLPKKNELPNPQVDAVVKEEASFSASFDSWGVGGKQADIDSDASSAASKSSAAHLKKKNLKRMAQKHVSQGIAHKLADSGSFVKDDDSTDPGDLSTAGIAHKLADSGSVAKDDESTDPGDLSTAQSIAHKLTDSGSYAKDDDSTHPGDLSTVADTATTGSTSRRFGASPLDSLVRKDAKENRADEEKEKSGVEGASLLSPSNSATPKPKPSSEKKANYLPPVVVRGKSPRANKLTVETVMDTISGAVDQDEEDLTPRTKKVVESLLQKKRRLQLQRRKMKTSQSFDSSGDKPSASASFNSADTGYEQVTPGGAAFEEKGISSSSSLPCRDTGPDCNDDLLPIDENADDFTTMRSNENNFPSAYTPLLVSDSTSIRFSPGHKARGVVSPKSEGGQSDGGFSFYSAASSAHTGISRNSSGSKNSSLANRAEKVVQERRQKWKARGSKDDQQRATELARRVLNGPQDAVAQQRTPEEDNYNFNAVSSNRRQHNDTSLVMEPSAARALAKREGLSTRYNTSSRFIDTDPSYGGAFAQPDPPVGRENTSFSTAESVDSSEFRSLGSATTESESEVRSARRRAKKKAAKYAKGKAHAKSKTNSNYVSNGIVSDEFVSESSANVEAFNRAYENVSLGQMAADLADEVSLSVKGGGFDFSKIATDVNYSFRKYCGIQTSDPVPFDDAAEAVHDSNTEDEDDPKGDLGACAAIDDTLECTVAGKSKWDQPSMAPAGQASFEGLVTSRKGIRAAYV